MLIGGDIMTKLEQDLEIAHALIENKEKVREYYRLFDRMWPFTTINMKEYFYTFEYDDNDYITNIYTPSNDKNNF